MADGGGRKRPLQKAKMALQALLKEQNGEDEDDAGSGSEKEEEEGGDQEDMPAGDDDGEDGKAEATPANLDREGEIADARQLLSKEKAKATLEKKTQAKAAALAIKEKNAAEKAAETTKAAGLRKRKTPE